MARGWHGDSEGHRKAGRLGGLKSAQTRKRKSRDKVNEFGEQLARDVVISSVKSDKKS